MVEVKVPEQGKFSEIATYFSETAAGEFDAAATKVDAIVVTPGDFEAATKLKEHVKTQKENFATNLRAMRDGSKELGDGIGKIGKKYNDTEDTNADVSTELNTTVTNVSGDLPGFDDYESDGQVAPGVKWPE